jgi:hypothetical protein
MNKKIGFTGVLGIGVVGLLAANVMIMSNLLTTEKEPAIPVSKEETANYQTEAAAENYESDKAVGIYQSSGGFTYLAAQNTDGGIDNALEEGKRFMLSRPEVLPEKSKLSKAEVLELSAKTLAGKLGLKKEDLTNFDYSLTSSKDSLGDDTLYWDIIYYPKNQSDFPKIYRLMSQINDETKEIRVFINYNSQEGSPLEHEIQEPKAKELAVSAIKQKYALTDETIGRFTVTSIFYVDYPSLKPDTHMWRIYLYPTNKEEYTEIGCYTAYLDAVSGEVIQLESAGDGIG